ncbi:hypothetical protein FW774_19280 [Pedobacter sp. BS3]|uniref:hypothetical protein n=1 Tax=Pedobacter sp. BS3 TaxID=2567937 RepID=UPI0011EEBF74|nr:hypothetical protein [Pedobacter sp. BS3]TZF81192.1 hypothetical protein FW774_19280 [Pedobacter sp. BS3]
MDWQMVKELLKRLTATYTQDSIRVITYNREIFPLILRFEDNERSADLYHAIIRLYEQLMSERVEMGWKISKSGS